MKFLSGLLLITILGVTTAVCPKEGCNGTVKDHKYFINPAQKYNFYAAVEECKQKNMSIITIDSADKVTDVNSLLDNIFEDKFIPNLYIGVWSLINSQFVWITSGDNLVFNNWHEGQPAGENKKCAHVGRYKSGEWNNIHCTKEIGYICE